MFPYTGTAETRGDDSAHGPVTRSRTTCKVLLVVMRLYTLQYNVEKVSSPQPLLTARDLLPSALGVTVPSVYSVQNEKLLTSSFSAPPEPEPFFVGLLVGDGGTAPSSLW